MGEIIEWFDRNFYEGFADRWDDTLFREIVSKEIDETTVMLDVGAGAGIRSQMNFKGIAASVCGIDLDERILDNGQLDCSDIGEAESLPYPDDTFDAVIANSVLEHLEEPDVVFREVFRVLRPGGKFLFKTPNKHHYVSFIARLTPHSFHEWVIGLRGRHAIDTFPTLYRANTPKDLRRIASTAGFDVICIHAVEGRPEYLRFSALVYPLGLIYERLVNKVESLSRYRVVLMGALGKPVS